MITANDTVICRVLIRIMNHRTMTTSCVQPGMLFCRFSADGKISAAEMVFDVMNFINQIQVNVRAYVYLFVVQRLIYARKRYDDIR